MKTCQPSGIHQMAVVVAVAASSVARRSHRCMARSSSPLQSACTEEVVAGPEVGSLDLASEMTGVVAVVAAVGAENQDGGTMEEVGGCMRLCRSPV